MELRYLFKKNNTRNQAMGVSTGDDASNGETMPATSGQANASEETLKPSAPDGLVTRCPSCGEAVFTDELLDNYKICPECGAYLRLDAMMRIESIIDPESFEPWDAIMPTHNPLGIPGYEAKLSANKEKTGLDEAVVTGKCRIGDNEAVLMVMDCRFMMASMGNVVGEKITRAVERATDERLPVIIFCCSGGARMQEGIVSLMQMAKTSASLKRHSDAGLLYVSVLTDPTTGGVTASFAMLGDIILAEPGALIGFAGPRVIEQTIGQKLPEGFQKAEFLLEHGFVDAIVERKFMRKTLDRILRLHQQNQTLSQCYTRDSVTDEKYQSKEKAIKTKPSRKALSSWDKVNLSRQMDRPVALDYTSQLFGEKIELHGDRVGSDDKAIYGAIAMYHGQPVTIIAQVKGRTTKENIERNFGMPSPSGYRKALRLMKQAEKFGRPVICFVDTPGAFCGIEAEENGQGEAIARNLFEMSNLKTPLLSIIIGEAGSGGALALAVTDEVWMLENAIYAILSPEGYASILWKDSKRAPEAATEMKLTAQDMLELGIIELVISEPERFDAESISSVLSEINANLDKYLARVMSIPIEELLEQRYQRFRKY